MYVSPLSFENRLMSVSRTMVQCPPKKGRSEHSGPQERPNIEGAMYIDVVTDSKTELHFNLSVQLTRQYDLRSVWVRALH